MAIAKNLEYFKSDTMTHYALDSCCGHAACSKRPSTFLWVVLFDSKSPSGIVACMPLCLEHGNDKRMAAQEAEI